MEREIAHNFEELDISIQIELLIKYIEQLQKGIIQSTRTLENVDVNVALKGAYKKLESLMNIG